MNKSTIHSIVGLSRPSSSLPVIYLFFYAHTESFPERPRQTCPYHMKIIFRTLSDSHVSYVSLDYCTSRTCHSQSYLPSASIFPLFRPVSTIRYPPSLTRYLCSHTCCRPFLSLTLRSNPSPGFPSFLSERPLHLVHQTFEIFPPASSPAERVKG